MKIIIILLGIRIIHYKNEVVKNSRDESEINVKKWMKDGGFTYLYKVRSPNTASIGSPCQVLPFVFCCAFILLFAFF